MKTIYKKLLYIVSIATFMFISGVSFAQAGNVYGSAWSEGVGWISFNNCSSPTNCNTSTIPSHGVTLDIKTNRVNGTAWNANIGIISFNPSEWGSCPPNAGGCNLSNFQNDWAEGGWARAISVVSKGTTNSGDWDGWISLGRNGVYDANIDKNTSVNMNDADFSSNTVYTIDNNSNGHWWGSDVVGWIDLNPVGGQPYDTNPGGVFVTNLSNDLSLTGPAYVMAGNEISLYWEVYNGFSPSDCQNMSNPGGSNWDRPSYGVSGTSGQIDDIEVNHNNNTPGTQTEFTIECTDGATTRSATWSVIVEEFKPQISLSFSCVIKTSSPTLDILGLDNADNPSCDFFADKPTSNRFVGNTTTPSITDTNFSGVNTNYTMQCTNGSANPASYSPPASTLVEVCTPFYSVTGDTRCGTIPSNEKYGGVFQKVALDYVASLQLTATPLFGFDTEPIAISSSDGNLVFSPSDFSLNGAPDYNMVTATYTISEAEYITSTNNGVDPIVVPINFNPSPKNSLTLNFCPVGTISTQIKPIYKPF